jgi:hemerythrin
MTSVDDLWTENMRIGIDLIDGHHKTLLGLACETRNTLDAGADRERIKEILAALLSYSKYHFLAEERVMFEYNHPRLKEQRAQHAFFVAKLDDCFMGLSNETTEFTRGLLAFLKDWYVHHILEEDKLIGSHPSP